MSGIKLDNFSTVDVNLTAIMATAQAMRNGHFALSLTEMDSTTIPQIAAGSIIDISGTLVYFYSNETITGTASDGVTYIKLIYSSGTIAAIWTATAPTFDSSKNGWYGTGGSSSHRYIASMIKSSTSYTDKKLYDIYTSPKKYETQSSFFIGTWTAGSSKVVTLTYSSKVTAVEFIYCDNCAGPSAPATEYFTYIESVVISNNTIVITLKALTGSGVVNGAYGIIATAIL